MVTEFFTFDNDGMGAALAVVLFIAVVPILVINVRTVPGAGGDAMTAVTGTRVPTPAPAERP